jgi:hypothetical protein
MPYFSAHGCEVCTPELGSLAPSVWLYEGQESDYAFRIPWALPMPGSTSVLAWKQILTTFRAQALQQQIANLQVFERRGMCSGPIADMVEK